MECLREEKNYLMRKHKCTLYICTFPVVFHHVSINAIAHFIARAKVYENEWKHNFDKKRLNNRVCCKCLIY